MKTPSKHAIALRAAQDETQLFQLALSDTVNGTVKWFGHSRTYSLGISRPTGAAGGIAIERIDGMASAYYFESYAPRQLERIACLVTGADTEHNRALLRQRETIEEAKAYIVEQQRTR